MKTAAIIERLSNNDETMKNFYQSLAKKLSKVKRTGDKKIDKDAMVYEVYKQPTKSVKDIIKPQKEKTKEEQEAKELIIELINQNRLKRNALMAKEVLHDYRVK